MRPGSSWMRWQPKPFRDAAGQDGAVDHPGVDALELLPALPRFTCSSELVTREASFARVDLLGRRSSSRRPKVSLEEARVALNNEVDQRDRYGLVNAPGVNVIRLQPRTWSPRGRRTNTGAAEFTRAVGW